MKKLAPTTIIILLLQISCLTFGQESVKLFNNTGNEEEFSEAYYYDESMLQYNNHNLGIIGSQHWRNGLNFDPTNRYSPYDTEQKMRVTNNLSELLVNKDSVQIQVTIADKNSPVWILLHLKDELESRGITVDYPAKGNQPADYLVEISSCQWHCQLSSLRVKKRRYTGNYRIEYEVKWKEKGAKETVTTESETQEQMTCEWEHKHKAEMEEIPNLSTTLDKLCQQIAKEKAEQIASVLKKETSAK